MALATLEFLAVADEADEVGVEVVVEVADALTYAPVLLCAAEAVCEV